MKKTIWVCYEREPPYLPVAIADSAKEIARKMGTTRNSVYSSAFHAKKEYKNGRFRKVVIEDYE